jgi:hypothetical protein
MSSISEPYCSAFFFKVSNSAITSFIKAVVAHSFHTLLMVTLGTKSVYKSFAMPNPQVKN